MTEKIRNKLKELGCDAWELTEVCERGWEFYFIRHELDQNRATDVRNFRVAVYRKSDDGAMVGRATGEIAPTASDEEIDKTLADLYFQASLVQNPAYELTDQPVPVPENPAPVDVAAIAEQFLRALDQVEESADADINSYEIFVKEIDRHYHNSNGVEAWDVYPSSEIEVVVNARREGHEIELFRVYESGTCDADKLKSDITKVLAYGRDRLAAVPTPKMDPIAVVFSTFDSVELYSFFAHRTNAALKYRQMSDWEKGEPISPEFAGDRVTLTALPALPNSSKNYMTDAEGSLIRQRVLIEDGVVREFWGDRQFSQYLGLADSSIVANFEVSGGTKTIDEIRSGDYLEVVEFSDFQADEVGCDFAGEIRLGYLHRGGEVKIVTGGSISGDMREAIKTMTFTKETTQYDTYEVPVATRLEKVKITGVE